MNEGKKIKAFSLLSGGLDSMLAVCVLRDQSVDVTGLTFESPFFAAKAGREAAAQLGIPLRVVDFTEDIISLLDNPKHGFGSNMNPCIDCHARMLKRAGKLMVDEGYHFLSTGEVLNERPMSQNRQSLTVVAKDSGYDGLIVRPLSGGLLPETIPEKEGWIDRARLLKLSGRGRKPQMALAEKYGIKKYPAPAGGCLLTEPNFSRRLEDLIKNEGMSLPMVKFLKIGRHFRLAPSLKIIVGRNKADNDYIKSHVPAGFSTMRSPVFPGPLCLLPPRIDEAGLALAAGICAGYCDGPKDGAAVTIEIVNGGTKTLREAVPLPREAFEKLML